MSLTETPSRGQARDRSGRRPGFGRSRNVRKPANVRSRSSSRAVRRAPGDASRVATASTRMPSRLHALVALLELAPAGPRRAARRRPTACTTSSTWWNAPLVMSRHAVGLADDDGDALADEVERDLGRACATLERSGVRASRIASSSGLARPVSSAALQRAELEHLARRRAGRVVDAPSSWTTPSVSVPVLSVQSTSMLPRFSIALRRRTSTPWRAIICAPRARLTLRIAGSSSGLRPTASATEKSSVSMGGRPRSMCADEDDEHHDEHRARQQIAEAADARGRTPSPAAERRAGARWRRTRSQAPVARRGSARCRCARSCRGTRSWSARQRSPSPPTAPACFSTGKLSPVSTASLTKKSVASSTTPSAGHEAAGRQQRRRRRARPVLERRPAGAGRRADVCARRVNRARGARRRRSARCTRACSRCPRWPARWRGR